MKGKPRQHYEARARIAKALLLSAAAKNAQENKILRHNSVGCISMHHFDLLLDGEEALTDRLRESGRHRSSRILAPNLYLPNDRSCGMMSSVRAIEVEDRPAAMSACEDE